MSDARERMKGKKLFLNLGSGSKPMLNYVNIDKEAGSSVDLVLDLEKGIPFSDNSVEKIYCGSFFEHLKNPNSFLKEVFRVLKKGASITIVTDNACCFAHYLPFKKVGKIHVGTHTSNEFEHYALYTMQDLQRHLNLFGFSHVSVKFFKGFGKWFSLFLKAEAIK